MYTNHKVLRFFFSNRSLSTFIIVTFDRNVVFEWGKKQNKAKKCSFMSRKISQTVKNGIG